MKKLLLIALVACFALSGASWASLLPNSDFEIDEDANGGADNWAFWGSNLSWWGNSTQEWINDPLEARSGGRCVHLRCGNAGDYAGCYQMDTGGGWTNMLPGKTYYVGAWCKDRMPGGEPSQNNPNFFIQYYTTANTPYTEAEHTYYVQEDGAETLLGAKGSSEWTLIYSEVRPPISAAAWIRASVSIAGTSGATQETEYYVDDMWLGTKPPPGAGKTPYPEDEAIDVPRDLVLGWTPGESAATYNAYLSTSFSDVNEAAAGALIAENTDVNSLDPGRLEFGVTYYWRVDDVNGAPDYTVHTGQMWSFTIEPYSRPITQITATASGSQDAEMIPEKTIDGSGLDEQDQHGTDATTMWLSGPGTDPWIQYDFDRAYKLDELLVWNSNQLVESFLGLGAKNVVIETSVNGSDWAVLEEATLFNQAPGVDGYAANTIVDFDGVMAQSVRITIQSGWGLAPQQGLSEVRFLYIPTFAREPQPEPGTVTDNANVELAWRPGREAASHEVYVGTDPADMALLGTSTENTFTARGLSFSSTYFWSVTEVNDAEAVTSHAGDTWSFTTPAFNIVDNFDQYDNDCQRIFFTWKDGLGHNGGIEIEGCDVPPSNGNEGGSIVGNETAPFAETGIVNVDSRQSLPLSYDNAQGQSEATRTLDAQDWTTSDIKTLSLFFYGQPDNTGQLYVKVNNTKVVYPGDAADLTLEQWQRWDIDLAGLNGLQTVTELAIGVDGASSAGTLYIDDIRLYP